MARRIRVQIDLAPYPSAVLTAAAAAGNVSTNTLAKSMLEDILQTLSVRVGPQPQAEGELLNWVEEIVNRYRKDDLWDEHVTLRIFELIQAEKIEVYERAISDKNRTRVNRTIGRLVRKTLRGQTRKSKGHIQRVQLPAGSHLISGYTCLFRTK